jgi:hypothetical protein
MAVLGGYDKSIKSLYNSLKYSAKKRGIPFSLTIPELNNLTFPITCPILGIPIRFNREQRDDSISIDRIDSDRGYEIDNIIVISWRANRLKSDASLNDMQRITEFYERLQ